jgi:hypothetical protein
MGTKNQCTSTTSKSSVLRPQPLHSPAPPVVAKHACYVHFSMVDYEREEEDTEGVSGSRQRLASWNEVIGSSRHGQPLMPFLR